MRQGQDILVFSKITKMIETKNPSRLEVLWHKPEKKIVG